MPKPNSENGLDTHSSTSKKWFSKISLKKIPKKLKNGKTTSTLTNALNASKKNNNTLDIPEPLSKCNPDNSISNQTICDSSENNSLSSGSFLNIKDGLSTQSSQITINTTKNETMFDEDSNSQRSTPIICISPSNAEPLNTQYRNMDINNITSSSSNICMDINRRNHIKLRPVHRRTSSDEHFNTPVQRPRSYSDTPVPVHPSILYADVDDDEFINEIPRNLKKDNYYLKDMDMDMEMYDIKTPILTATPSNGKAGKTSGSLQTTSVATTPVLKHHNHNYSHSHSHEDQDNFSSYTKTTPTPDRKLIGMIEAMQNKNCGNMTAKEFALAVGININDSEDEDEEEDEDNNSVNTISSTLSQLTANGKVPTPNEIYNALSVKNYRQKRKHSASLLNLEMFIPPSPNECHNKMGSSNQSIKSEISGVSGTSGKSCSRAMGDLNHKISNSKLEKRLPPTTNKSNGSGSTYVVNSNNNYNYISNSNSTTKFSSASSIHSSHSGNTTTYMSDLPENDYDSYCSSNSYLQQSIMNSGGAYPIYENIGKNNVSTTFYSLPRVKFHSCNNSNNSISASKSTNSIPASNIYISNYNAYRDMGGIGCHNRRHSHSRVASSISINSQTSSVKKVSPPSPSINLNNANSKLNSNAINSINASKLNNNLNNSDHHNMYINSKTIAISNASSAVNCCPSPTTPNVCSTSWSNGLSDIDNLRLAASTSKPKDSCSQDDNNSIKVYTKGRFTITHEHYNHNRTTPDRKSVV